jgi:hypothetical protein
LILQAGSWVLGVLHNKHVSLTVLEPGGSRVPALVGKALVLLNRYFSHIFTWQREEKALSWVWWYTLVIPALGRLRQEG